MLKNYLKVTWRSLKKNKLFTFLNVSGLSVAFAVAILLAMAGFFDLSYDRFHKNVDSLYQVYIVEQTAKGPSAGTSQPAPLVNAIKEEVPGVTKASRYLQDDTVISFAEKEISMDAVWVDEDFFDMFTFPIVLGKANNPLEELSSIVITEESASKLFGEATALGQIVQILIDGDEKPFTIAAIVEDNLPQSSLEFEVAIRFEKHGAYEDNKDAWNAKYHDVYVQLDSGMPSESFQQSTRSLVNLNFQEEIELAERDGALTDATGQYIQLHLLPMVDVNFANFGKGYAEVSRGTPYLVLGIAFLILFIACVNYINMSIAKSGQRLREIGMRKTLGAQKKQLFTQFWAESLLVFLISLGIGVVSSVFLIDDFKSIFRTDVSFDMMLTPINILLFITVVLIITLLAGGYPALLMSKLGTIQSLKGKLETSGKNRVRDALMVLQFGIAILLISGTLVLWSQLDYMRNKDLGYNKEQVLSIPLDGKKNSYEAIELLRNELGGNPDILSISGSDNNLGYGKDGSVSKSMFGFEYKDRLVNTNLLTVDYDYIETLDLEMVEGRNFERGFASDSSSVVINEAMAREFGEKDPLTAYVSVSDSIRYPVIGVVKDYNFEKLDKAIEPITMVMNPNWDLYYAYIKVAPTNMVNSFEAVEKAWAKIEPNAIFQGSFLDENVNRTFRREKIMTTMITSGSVIAIVLSCIGLFAMSLLTVNQRTKEIGVRKVLGASIGSIAVMLTKDFMRLVVISFLIASPVAWWFMQKWLENYAFKIDLSVWFFVIAGIFAMVIAILTVGSRTIKAALQNPVKSLRTE